MRSSTILSTGTVAFMALTLCALNAQSASSTGANRMFLKKAIEGDLAQIRMGELAQEKGTNEEVKKFGEKLVTDHGANLEAARSVAQSIGLEPPTTTNANQNATHDRLNKLSGAQFDRKFAERMVQDHKNDIKEFRHESKKSGPIADFAKQTLPTLHQHLQIAESLNRSTMGSAR
jgi:putative membrane protein